MEPILNFWFCHRFVPITSVSQLTGVSGFAFDSLVSESGAFNRDWTIA